MSTPNLDRLFHEQWPAVVATLTRRLNDLQLAEDAAQDAFAKAAELWPREGVPPRPGGWLMVTAWRKALDHLRKEGVAARYAEDLWRMAGSGESIDAAEIAEAGDDALVSEDDQLCLIFMCCHPALALEVQVALTLRYVAGLSTAEISRAFLLSEPTLAQRLVRAKRKIRAAGIGFGVPGPDELVGRLASVRRVVYLVFTEGYSATRGRQLVRAELCDEAIRLSRLLCRLVPKDPENRGLLALMLLHHARSPGRQDAQERPIPLAEQDRATWRHEMIAEGIGLVENVPDPLPPGPYRLQAAIAAVHAKAPNFARTDWTRIAALYGELARVSPSPVIEVNRAVAVGMAYGPQAGLSILNRVLASDALTAYAPLHAAHADLLRRAGAAEEAAASLARAVEATQNEALRSELSRRLGANARPRCDDPSRPETDPPEDQVVLATPKTSPAPVESGDPRTWDG
ncbi:sigma-70 family RNA polymerase sigma factor [Actinomadura napierensis]|uniref:Sigma-70 family RNA polymerase sigma factor n=2 Tax=Actinomadura napierensis TaxID=267854 RepID=A0ABN3A303_9ACTN